ncbi:poly [ADP-ribose] polymerase tankyrase-2-like [Leptopilina heterotoma]|uniref:poly [ADP-ribose] polymerase tankyrase-2-like n=1 Tax=Leptopilina heterotoma TaxID=63436 RepID=UPI001CA9F0EB|nr:poly [ADP-ribose] polymerase tankyrase-2-like [Leptopilina heterotoma]
MSQTESDYSDDEEKVEVLDERFVKFSKAVDDKDKNLISSLIKQEEGILQIQFHSDCTTFLHVVAQRGTVDDVKLLCESGAKVNLRNKNGETPIFYAIKNHDIGLVKTLIEHGSNLNIISSQNVTPLHLALLHGSEATLRLIVKKILLSTVENGEKSSKKEEGVENGEKLESAKKEEDDESMEESASEDDSMMMSSDCENSSDYEDVSDEESEDPEVSSDPEDSETVENLETTIGVIKTLLKNKELFKLNKNDYPLLMFFASRIQCGSILDVILRDCRKFLKSMTPEERKLERSNTRKANSDYYSEGGCNVRYKPHSPEDINFQGYFDRTALHYAVRAEITLAVKFLLEHGADVNAKTCEKLTPLHYAACLENINLCHLLLAYNAFVNCNYCCQGNPLYHVCGPSTTKVLLKSTESYYYDEFFDEYTDRLGKDIDVQPTFNPQIMTLMLKNGAHPDNRGENGASAFHEACQMGRFREVKLLLKYDVYLEGVDMDGNTALHHAAKGHSMKMCEFLVKKGLKIDVAREDGKTPLMSAITYKENLTPCLETIEYLVDHGANVNAKERFSGSILKTAVSDVEPPVIECLLELGANIEYLFEISESYFNSYGVFRFHDNHQFLISYIALKGKDLTDYLQSYIKHDNSNVKKAFNYFEKAKVEMEKLRSMRILKTTSITFYEFLTSDFYNTVQSIKNGRVVKILNAGDYKTEFPCFNIMLECRFQRAKALKKFVNQTYDYFSKNRKLSSDVVKLIFKNLGSKEFRIFGRALNKK